MNADTSRSHASYRNDDTQKAYSIGDTMNSGRSNQQDQTTIKSSSEDILTVSLSSNTKQQCRFGSNCRQLSDSTHCDRFQHPSQTSSLNTVAPPDDQLSNMNADTSSSSRSHATSNTKQQCRYGSNCRQLSDSTHCDRFQHPTQTISAFGAAASSDDRLSNKSFDTSSSSHIHTKHGDDMQKASSIGDTMNSGRSNQSDQTTKKTLSENIVTVSIIYL
ncbi:unnamed protein product [Rotaria sp. Silwood1]|nr:unnamed protein product [Rotaria sp. Silwood1]